MRIKTIGKVVYFIACLNCGIIFGFTVLISSAPNIERDLQSNPIFWNINDLPIIITMNYESNQVHLNAMRDAIGIWNQGIGQEVFVGPELLDFYPEEVGEPHHSGGVFLYPVEKVGEALKSQLYASARKFYSGTYINGEVSEIVINSCKVNFLNNTRQDILTNVFVHELGHCLGFNHDWNNRSSIMFPMIFNETKYQSLTEIHKTHIRNMLIRNQAL